MNKNVLSVNGGSSSLKFQLFNMPEEHCLISGYFDGVCSSSTRFIVRIGTKKYEETLTECDFAYAVDYLITFLIQQSIINSLEDIDYIGHRVAHGGEHYSQPVIINSQVKNTIAELTKLAPIHNPINLLCIEAFEATLPNAVHVAVFDTAYHQTLDEVQFLYPLPYELYERYGIRRFGFHGISHQYISTYVTEHCSADKPTRVISCHLGSGASICAIKGGKSVATSMGFTPLAGLMMGTRCGDIDPSLPIYLATNTPMSNRDVSEMMNNASGLLGVSGMSDDCRVLEEAGELGHSRAALALQMFEGRVIETIGAYAALLNGIDILVFTGGIGENSSIIRKNITDSLGFMGISIDEEENNNDSLFINTEDSNTKVMVINTDEQRMIARETIELIGF
ncbi:acetate/propionate family kinase [Photobacterium sp. DNB23_23_1]